jgi:hypothetical protein
MPLPNLIIIGAMKCGTTSMHHYLRRHPQIAMSSEKELNFFIEERNWPKGLDWYAAQFPGGTEVRGESSPNYTAAVRFPGVPARMHSVVPDARLLYMVRDPVERLISHWMHNYSRRIEQRALQEVARDRVYIDRSLYWTQISAFLEYYARSQILVVSMDELENERRATMRKVFDFLGVTPDFYSPVYAVKMHRSAQRRRRTAVGTWLETTRMGRSIEALPGRVRWPLSNLVYFPFSRSVARPVLTEHDRLEISSRLQEDVSRFREFTGRDFAEWSL